MSYILEALKKSQQERELGQVPSLRSVNFEEPALPRAQHTWAYAAVMLAVVAVGIALYAVLKQPPESGLGPAFERGAASERRAGAQDGLAAAVVDSGSAAPLPLPASAASAVAASMSTRDPEDTRDAGAGRATGVASDSQPELPAELPAELDAETESERFAGARGGAVPSPAAAASRNSDEVVPTSAASAPTASDKVAGSPASPADPALAADDPNSLSVEPRVLVVPAPAKPGEPLPRGADELRRAVLGGDDSPSVAGAPALRRAQNPDQVAIPDDLIADIEAFKQEVQSGKIPVSPAPAPPPPAQRREPQSTPAPTPARGGARAPVASPALRAKLPPFRMSVHVFDSDPIRRFVYINGRKVGENEQSREGVRVEQVVSDGAILSYGGERFFEPR
ncbi:MAG: general secretion pathway protein GspB [Thiohalocapsa sp.]|nr:general secretion pathway protein GspB [Thiohalocapsa sp.]